MLDEEVLQPVCEARDCAHAIHDLKYNPQATVLAAACADRHVDLYTVGLKRYSRVARCAGHSAAVRSLDWRVDGKVLQSACAACELLYWSGTTGRQTTECQRDAEWATWTCALGFPVMGIWCVCSLLIIPAQLQNPALQKSHPHRLFCHTCPVVFIIRA